MTYRGGHLHLEGYCWQVYRGEHPAGSPRVSSSGRRPRRAAGRATPSVPAAVWAAVPAERAVAAVLPVAPLAAGERATAVVVMVAEIVVAAVEVVVAVVVAVVVEVEVAVVVAVAVVAAAVAAVVVAVAVLAVAARTKAVAASSAGRQLPGGPAAAAHPEPYSAAA